MTTEEKLQHFYDVSVGEAHKEAEKLIKDHVEMLDQQLDNHKKMRQRELEVQLKTETDNASREINKALSVSQLEIKRKWTKKQNELIESLFAEVKTLLEDFMKTPAYDDYLVCKIKEALEFAEEDEVTIYLTPADAEKATVLSEKTGVALEISETPFMGGIKATIPHKNILIDNSFLEAFSSEKAGFTFDGGLTYE